VAVITQKLLFKISDSLGLSFLKVEPPSNTTSMNSSVPRKTSEQYGQATLEIVKALTEIGMSHPYTHTGKSMETTCKQHDTAFRTPLIFDWVTPNSFQGAINDNVNAYAAGVYEGSYYTE
jgi:hypothetical protein